MQFQKERPRFYAGCIEIVVIRKEREWSVYIMRYLVKGVSIIWVSSMIIIRSVVSLFIMQYVLCVSWDIRTVGIIVSIVDMWVSLKPVKGVWCTIASVVRSKKVIKNRGGMNRAEVLWMLVVEWTAFVIPHVLF
ncbi:hypothetical protein F5Y04DRAFT_60824 [Hypomontagnella monticulosa]|nr:hypothetical protein F5Y04DRAFT_60824 [Hypomontagnella monticulosa]